LSQRGLRVEPVAQLGRTLARGSCREGACGQSI
jgi:hypothetical protein